MDTVIAPQSPVWNLGVWLDSNLSIGDHITKTSSATFYCLSNIRMIRKYLSKECTEILIHAFISSHLDYCNSLLHGLLAYHIQKLQRAQNAAARLVFEESKFRHITPLRALHWLPVAYRIVLKFYCSPLRPFINLLRLKFPNLYLWKTLGVDTT